jgi:general secretion pathway protein E
MWKRPRVAERQETVPPTAAQALYAHSIDDLLLELNPASDDYATVLTDRVLQLAARHNASDIHLDAQPDGYLLRLRIDGNLREIGCLPRGVRTHLAGRIKSLAQLLTYRSDLPQEGRMTFGQPRREARVVTFPTLHGERVVIRLVATQERPWRLRDLGLNAEQLARHEQALRAQAGVVVITGSALVSGP